MVIALTRGVLGNKFRDGSTSFALSVIKSHSNTAWFIMCSGIQLSQSFPNWPWIQEVGETSNLLWRYVFNSWQRRLTLKSKHGQHYLYNTKYWTYWGLHKMPVIKKKWIFIGICVNQNMSSLVWARDWRQTCAKPLPEPVINQFINTLTFQRPNKPKSIYPTNTDRRVLDEIHVWCRIARIDKLNFILCANVRYSNTLQCDTNTTHIYHILCWYQNIPLTKTKLPSSETTSWFGFCTPLDRHRFALPQGSCHARRLIDGREPGHVNVQ